MLQSAQVLFKSFLLDSSLNTLRQAHTHKSQEAGIRSRYFDPHLLSEKARTP